jgi:aspartate kinase
MIIARWRYTMKILIQKFGGTSVASKEGRDYAAEKIVAATKQDYSPVIVVSAMGRMGQPYATDSLINLIQCISSDMEKKEMDKIMACGEIISCGVFSATLRNKGLRCSILSGRQAGIITDDNYGNAAIIRVETDTLLRLLDEGIIPVVAGFQGVTEDGDVTTLGRGGSDTTAAVLGEALRAEEIQIYTDVDGIMTADPRIVPTARVINNMGYNEVFQFADQGAKVIHPRAVEFAMRSNIPIVIRNTMTDSPGTMITRYADNKSKLVTGITHKSERTQVYINNQDVKAIDDEIVFSTLAECNISIDLINVFPAQKVFTVDSDYTDKVESILTSLGLKYEVIKNCSKISIIGAGIMGVPGVMARVIKALRRKNIEILQTSDSYTTIWCLVRNCDTKNAILSLHDEFDLSK